MLCSFAFCEDFNMNTQNKINLSQWRQEGGPTTETWIEKNQQILISNEYHNHTSGEKKGLMQVPMNTYNCIVSVLVWKEDRKKCEQIRNSF